MYIKKKENRLMIEYVDNKDYKTDKNAMRNNLNQTGKNGRICK